MSGEPEDDAAEDEASPVVDEADEDDGNDTEGNRFSSLIGVDLDVG